MKTLRQTCAATILTLAIAVSALAGQIDSPGAKPPSEPPSSFTTTVILTLVSLVR